MDFKSNTINQNSSIRSCSNSNLVPSNSSSSITCTKPNLTDIPFDSVHQSTDKLVFNKNTIFVKSGHDFVYSKHGSTSTDSRDQQSMVGYWISNIYIS